MPRRPRVVMAGVPHHITQRGNNRQPVFLASDDRIQYLELLGRHAAQYGARILGYCLMTNHVHLIATPETAESLARALGRTHSEYALATNRHHGRSGHVWQNRFFSCALDQEHLLSAMRYIELNPVRAHLVDVPWDWPWSSARAHVTSSVFDPVLHSLWTDGFGGWDYEDWEEILAGGIDPGEAEAVRHATSTGEPLGSREFVAGLERRAGKPLRVLGRGRPKKKPPSLDTPAAQRSLFAVTR